MSVTLDSLNSIFYSQEDDALQNIFDFKVLKVPAPIETLAQDLGINLANFILRVSKFTIPDDTLSTQEITIRGITVSRILGAKNTTNDLTIELILDREWKYYKFFKAWKDYYGDVAINESIPSDTITGELYVTNGLLNREERGFVSWTFLYARLYKLGDISFDYATGEPISMSVGFKYCGYKVE